MKKSLFALLIIAIIFISSCEEPAYAKEELIGKWECYQINENGKIKPVIRGGISFSFEENSYDYTGGAYKEKGKWSIKGKNLVTQAEDLIEKKVEIGQLKNDSMTLNMVDNGIPTTLYLAKE